MMKRKGRAGVLVGLLAWLVLLAGCAAGPEVREEVDPRERLLSRVQAYNAARVDWDPLLLYEMHWSGYREKVDLNRFLQTGRGNMRYVEFQIRDVLEFDPEMATVRVVLDFESMGFTFPGRREDQVWVWEEGDWFIRIEPVWRHPMGGELPIQ